MKRREWLMTAAVGTLAAAWPAAAAQVASATRHPPASSLSIPSVCAWPKLERLADGMLVAVIFNQPCHGLWEGDLE